MRTDIGQAIRELSAETMAEVQAAMADAIVLTVEDAQKRVRRKTGYLQSSVRFHMGDEVVTATASRPTYQERASQGAKGPPDVRQALANWKIGQPLQARWKAWYAGFQEYGNNRRLPGHLRSLPRNSGVNFYVLHCSVMGLIEYG